MNNRQHPIEPPSQELVRKWIEDRAGGQTKGPVSEDLMEITTQAARWGADQELDACCEWLQDPDLNVDTYKLRTDRRPKPPSEKEKALEALGRIDGYAVSQMKAYVIHDELIEDMATIRKVLEALSEDAQ